MISLAEEASWIRTANTSPPQRATVPRGGTTARSRRATWARTRSPALGPAASFTLVNASRSTRMTPGTPGVSGSGWLNTSRARSSR